MPELMTPASRLHATTAAAQCRGCTGGDRNAPAPMGSPSDPSGAVAIRGPVPARVRVR
nr:hypothetical protein JVH1_6788 [Rhodococcus sp. JVH1]